METVSQGPANERKTVAIVIVTYKSKELVRDCLLSLRTKLPDSLSVSVHISDNASNDGTLEMLRDEFPEVAVNARADNGGFAVANNEILRNLRTDYVLLLNPDTRLENDVISPLIEIMTARPTVGLIGCRLILNDGSFDHAAKRNFPTPMDSLQYMFKRRGRGSATYLAPEVGERDSGRVDAVNGAFMFMRNAALRQAGFFDEQYWMYGEDLDLAKSLNIAGWDTWYEGSLVVRHVKGGISGRWRKQRLNYEFHRSMAIYYRKHHAGKNRAMDLTVYSGIAAKLAASSAQSLVMRGVANLRKSRQRERFSGAS